MRTHAAVLIAVIASIAPAAQQSKGTASISGTVTAADTGQPVRRATVQLISADKRPNETTTTDGNGRFAFRELVAGAYSVTARKVGFIPWAHGQTSPGGAPRRVQLDDGERFNTADIRLARGGVIAGRVFDEHGDPLVEAELQIYRAQYLNGLRQLTSLGRAAVNDLGQFRFYGLAPGTYYVGGAVRAPDTVPSGESAPLRIVFPAPAHTFYPGVLASSDARPIVVEAGQEIANLDFTVLSSTLARITGRVVDSRGRPMARAVLSMSNASHGAINRGVLGANTKADGSFSLPPVGPGEYRLFVHARVDREIEEIAARNAGRPVDPDAAEMAIVPLSVAGQDLEGLVVTTAPGHTVSGRIVAEGPALSASGITISAPSPLITEGLTGLTRAGSNVQADLTFRVPRLIGTRIIRVNGLPEGWALKAVRANGADVTDAGFDVRTDVNDVEVVVTAAPSAVTGAVVDRDGRPAGDRLVVVFSEDPSLWLRFMNRHVTSARTTPAGTFTVSPLPRGSYFAAVIEPTNDAEWMAPESLERLRSSAAKFTIADGEQQRLRLVLR